MTTRFCDKEQIQISDSGFVVFHSDLTRFSWRLGVTYHNLPLQPLKMHCGSCSLVTSSGHLTGGGRGKEIDSAECVIRMNDAPSGRGFGPDVGRRTTLRVIAHSSMQRVLRSRHELLNSSHDTVFIFWGPSNYMRRDGKGLIYNNLRLMNQVLPKLKVYIISWQKMLQFDELFKKETGKDRYEKSLVMFS